MYFIDKTFKEFPAAHRQPKHTGHCSQIHGHSWAFSIRLSSPQLDEHGFVFDFGKFGPIKEWLTEMFDHTLLLQHDDPQLEHLQTSLKGLARIKVLDSVSAEGLARLLFQKLSDWLANDTVKVVSVTVHEDWKNSATYCL